MNNADKSVHGELKQVGETCIKDGGLTKREHFAGLAMQGLCANANLNQSFKAKDIARYATSYADALLAELEK